MTDVVGFYFAILPDAPKCCIPDNWYNLNINIGKYSNTDYLSNPYYESSGKKGSIKTKSIKWKTAL